MNSVNKTLYIPLYGKSFVSKKGIILSDPKAEWIWEKEGFELKGKSKSKWLAYYMAMRSATFDKWLMEKMKEDEEAIILHMGCGMDSRIDRIGARGHQWYDIDFPEVISTRKKYYTETEHYHMIEADLRTKEWLSYFDSTKEKRVIIVLEGVSMYLQVAELKQLFNYLNEHFGSVKILMDCYTEFAAKATKYKNPINEVGVKIVYGIGDPIILEEATGMIYIKEHEMTPINMVNELHGIERGIFKYVFAGRLSKGIYRMFEYESEIRI